VAGTPVGRPAGASKATLVSAGATLAHGGCEGRISAFKRRHGLSRCRYRGPQGMERWVRLGVIANNLLALARAEDLKARKLRKR